MPFNVLMRHWNGCGLQHNYVDGLHTKYRLFIIDVTPSYTECISYPTMPTFLRAISTSGL